MSVRFDAAADRLLRTTDLLDMNSTYSWGCWVRIVTDLNAQSTFFALDDNNINNIDVVRTAANGTQLQLRCSIAGTGTNVSGTDIGTGTWRHIMMVRESQTSLKLYLDGVLDATATDNMTGRASALRMEHGAIRDTNAQPSDSRVAAIKAWSVALTAAEVAREVYTIRPVRTANLYGFWPVRPGSGERVKDYSGNGRDWTEAGTLTDEDPPPISWGARALFPPYTAVSVTDPTTHTPTRAPLSVASGTSAGITASAAVSGTITSAAATLATLSSSGRTTAPITP